jgi:fatty-acyl-CoA synthase
MGVDQFDPGLIDLVDVAHLLRCAAKSYPDVTAVEDSVRSLRLSQLIARAERIANALDDHGIAPGARVGILAENRSEYVEVDAALALARRVRVALNTRLSVDDHRHVVADSEMDVLFHSGRFADTAETLRSEFSLLTISLDPVQQQANSLWLEDIVEAGRQAAVRRDPDASQPAWLTYTSGTTGRPKGIILSHRSIRQVALNLLLELGPVTPGEFIVLPQQLSHGAGYFVLPYLISGGGLRVMHDFDPEEVSHLSQRPEVRTLKLVPAMLPPLLGLGDSHPFEYASIVYGAAPMPPPVLDAALDRFGPILAQVYGQSEAPVTLTFLGKDDHRFGPQRHSAGRPWRTVAVEVRDPGGAVLPPGEQGEVSVTGLHQMTAYHRLPEATAEVMRDGWIMTRDLGVFDERGFLHLLGRIDEIINSGGYNIAPREVEGVLSSFQAVEEVVVVGMPHPRWGSSVAAMVKLLPEAIATADELIAFARPRLGFRCPKVVTIVDEIPKTAYGKVDRHEVLGMLTRATDEVVS